MTAPSDTEALIWALSTRLIANASATDTLLAWCEEYGLSYGPIALDVRQRFAPAIVPDEVMAVLDPAPGTTIHYRQVQLMRGTLPLVMAENWYVPQRLMAGMNERLQTTNAPFGTVVAPLRPCRRTLVANAWPFIDEPVENHPRFSGSARQACPEIILEHKAMILSNSGTSLALVHEFFFAQLVSGVSPTSVCKRATECEA
jgi:chorismate-pyruvate lyase